MQNPRAAPFLQTNSYLVTGHFCPSKSGMFSVLWRIFMTRWSFCWAIIWPGRQLKQSCKQRWGLGGGKTTGIYLYDRSEVVTGLPGVIVRFVVICRNFSNLFPGLVFIHVVQILQGCTKKRSSLTSILIVIT